MQKMYMLACILIYQFSQSLQFTILKRSIITESENSLREHIKIQTKTIVELKDYLKLDNKKDADIYVNHLLVKNISAENWKNRYDTICSEKGIHQPELIDDIWLPYAELLSDIEQVSFTVISVDVAHNFTSVIREEMQSARHPSIDSSESETAIETMVMKLEDNKEIFDEDFLLVIDSGYGNHFVLYALNIDDEQFISFESSTAVVPIERKEAKYYLDTFSAVRAKLDEDDDYDTSKGFELFTPNVSVQKDEENCFYFAMLNAKFFANEIITKFLTREIFQLKMTMAYEMLNEKLFPLR
ncbi:hypothetical protein SNEBB_000132 [Seison nebaliae]|nr:hypothetical protein SNEBB_000132 [Seison nebaliae]